MNRRQRFERFKAAFEDLEPNDPQDRYLDLIDDMLCILIGWRERMMKTPPSARATVLRAKSHLTGMLQTIIKTARTSRRDMSPTATGEAPMRPPSNLLDRASTKFREATAVFVKRDSLEEMVDEADRVFRSILVPPPPSDVEFAAGFDEMVRIFAWCASLRTQFARTNLPTIDDYVADAIESIAKTRPDLTARAKANTEKLRKAIENLSLVRRGRAGSGKRVPSAVAEKSLADFLFSLSIGASGQGLKKRRQRMHKRRKSRT